MAPFDIELAWLAGIIDGEGCFSVKRGRGAGRSHQLWLVLCNTSEAMILRVVRILDALGVKHSNVRKVWKGEKATRWQFWLDVTRKHDLLRATEAVLPHLTAKKTEAEIAAWFLRRACAVNQYRASQLDRVMLDSMSAIKRNGGEAPADIAELIREVIPSQAVAGDRQADDQAAEGVETRSVSPTNNPTHECPASLN